MDTGPDLFNTLPDELIAAVFALLCPLTLHQTVS